MTDEQFLKGITARFEAEMEKFTREVAELNPKLEEYGDRPHAAPLKLNLKAVTLLARMEAILSLIATEEEWAKTSPQIIAFLRLMREKTAPHPFIAARDAQLAAGPARIQIEEYLNSLSQGGLEQIAEALAQGGQLRVVVRK